MNPRIAYLASPIVMCALLVTPAAQASPVRTLHFRAGLTLSVPRSWQVYEPSKDWVRVVTGDCPSLGHAGFGFGDSGCHSFWILGPKAIKFGHGGDPYTPDGPFNLATGVSYCPYDKGLWEGLDNSNSVRGLRRIGAGHRADYRAWPLRCHNDDGEIKITSVQREWYLPVSKILIVDQWKTRKLASILRHASWQR